MVARLTVQAFAVCAGEVSSRYRQHAASAVHRAPGRGHRDPATLRYLAWISDFLEANGAMTEARRERLAEKEAEFRPRVVFWAQYAFRWVVYRAVPSTLRTRLRAEQLRFSGAMRVWLLPRMSWLRGDRSGL